MPGWQCDRDGRTRCCKACGECMMSSPRYDGSGLFCKRKRCIKKREKQAEKDALKDMEQGGPLIKVVPLPLPELFGEQYV